MTETVTESTARARRSVAAARMAAGEPWQDDSDRDIFWLAQEAQNILARLKDRIAYDEWKRKYWLTWRWRTYRPEHAHHGESH